MSDERDFLFKAKIEKVDEDEHLVYGWAYVCEVNGVPVEDHSGERIDIRTLKKGAHLYVRDFRKGKFMHDGKDPVAELADSMVFTKELQQALDIDLGKVGWMVSFKVHNEALWQEIKKGNFSMFSIGGMARREEIV